MKVLGKIHEILRRRIDKENPDSDYYEIYPVTVVDAVYLSEDRDQTLGELLIDLESSYDTFVDSIQFPVTGVQVYNGKQFGPIKKGNVTLTAKDFGLGNVNNTADKDKPVSDPQRQYINTYISTISQEISSTIDHVDDWNKHLTDYNNPHHVTWEQVAPGITIQPDELLDQKELQDLVKQHNESIDLSTLHPTILDQIHTMQSQLTEIEKTIHDMDTSVTGNIDQIVDKLIQDHNNNDHAHPTILNQLTDLSNRITEVIYQYSGLNGVELSSNKVNVVDLPLLINSSPTDSNNPYQTQYPSVAGLRDFMTKLNITSYPNVEYLASATTAQINAIKDKNPSGIIFVDALDSVNGTHIFVYSNKEFLVNYSLPSPTQNFEVLHVEHGPTRMEAVNTYGDRNVLLLCDKSISTKPTDTTWNQSLCIYTKQTLMEYVLDKVVYQGQDHLWEVLYTPDNISSNYQQLFLSGKGLLFVESLYMPQTIEGTEQYVNTGRPGVVMYQQKDNPAYTPGGSQPRYLFDIRHIPLGGNTRNVIMKECLTQPNPSDVTTSIFPPDGTGLVYVKNMYTADSGIPGFECWYMGKKLFSQALHNFAQESYEIVVNGNGGTLHHVHQLRTEFEPNSIKVISVISGFNVPPSFTGALTIDSSFENIQSNNVTVSTTVSNSVQATFTVTVFGTLK